MDSKLIIGLLVLIGATLVYLLPVGIWAVVLMIPVVIGGLIMIEKTMPFRLGAVGSKPFSFNSLDLQGLVKLFAVSGAGALITYLPTLEGYTYVYRGHDFTALALILITVTLNALKSYVANNQTVPQG